MLSSRLLLFLVAGTSLSILNSLENGLDGNPKTHPHENYVTFVTSWSTFAHASNSCSFWHGVLDSVYILVAIDRFTGIYPLKKLDNRFFSSIPVYYYKNGRRYLHKYNTEKIQYYNYESGYVTITLRIESNAEGHVMYGEYLDKEIAGSFCLDSSHSYTNDDEMNCSYLVLDLETKNLSVAEDPGSLNVKVKVKDSSKNVSDAEDIQSSDAILPQERETQPGRHRRSVDSLEEIKYIEIFLVCDQSVFREFGSSTEIIIKRSMDLVQEVDTIFRQYKIRVVLDGIEIWNDGDKINITTDGQNVLRSFSYFAEDKITRSDHVHLLTGFDSFTGRVAGLAYVGYICSMTWSTGFTTDFYHRSIYATASVLAHELGHNLGMTHDDEATTHCACASSHCLMHARMVYPPAKYFSSCSIDTVNKFLKSDRLSCLANQPLLSNYTQANFCGNGIVEEREECDCGSKYFCTNPCCDSNTCLLTKGSECAHGKCCGGDCKIVSNHTLCRNITDECDLHDYCDGETTHCKDYHKEDGTSCSVNGTCYQGNCKSRDLQCNHVWGAHARNAHVECYLKVNTVGRWYGNCGMDEREAFKEDFKACEVEHAQCGTLQCTDVSSHVDAVGWRSWFAMMRLHIKGVEHKCVVGRTAERQQADHGE